MPPADNPTWVKADPATPLRLTPPTDPDGRSTLDPPGVLAAEHHVLTLGAAHVYGDLEDIYLLLTRAADAIRQIWVDPTHQPGEPINRAPTGAADEALLANTRAAWQQWLDSDEAQFYAPDVPITEFHRTHPQFFHHLDQLIAAATVTTVCGNGRTPPLFPRGVATVTLLRLADGRVKGELSMLDGTRRTTTALTRHRLTPSIGGNPAAAEALAIIAAEVRAAAGAPPPATPAH